MNAKAIVAIAVVALVIIAFLYINNAVLSWG